MHKLGFGLLTIIALHTSPPASAGVYLSTDYFYGPSEPDPFFVEDGDRHQYVHVNESSHLVVNGGRLIGLQLAPRAPIRLLDESTAEVNGGILEQTLSSFHGHVFHVQDQSNLVVNGGKFYDTAVGGSLLYVTNGAHATINGGEFVADHDEVFHPWSSGGLTINGGDFTAKNDVVVEHRGRGKVVINGGSFRSPTYAVKMLLMAGEIEVHGGDFEETLGLRQDVGVVEWHALEASINGRRLEPGSIQESAGSIDLTFADGTQQTIPFIRLGGEMWFVRAVPEPAATITVWGVVGITAASSLRVSRSARTEQHRS